LAVRFVDRAQQILKDHFVIDGEGPIETLAQQFELMLSKKAYGNDAGGFGHYLSSSRAQLPQRSLRDTVPFVSAFASVPVREVIHRYLAEMPSRARKKACQGGPCHYLELVLQVFGSETWEPCRVKPAGFTISGHPSFRQPTNIDRPRERAQCCRDMLNGGSTVNGGVRTARPNGEGHTPSPDTPKYDENSVPSGPLPLNGCHILVVEDEYLIAADIADLLREAGAHVIGPAASLPEGLRLARDAQQINAAVLNIDLGGVTVFPLADQLLARGVRIMFLTGYSQSNIPAEYAAIHCCRKPTGPACVIEELKALLRPLAA
jgi:CheY-like chemotaxis protein